ncbi:MAG: CPBP family intramembrane metalloprotease [Muribaculaceae bacterium]|nr:CPBP family intramembrane metalloprotease [Muribaculaceae bacterium]
MSKIRFLIPSGMRLILLLLTFVVGAVATGLLSGVLMDAGGIDRKVAMLRIATIAQDLLMMVVPALVTALICTRQPVRLMAIAKAPDVRMTVSAIMVMLVSSPLMSWIIDWNASMHLPESMSALEASIRSMEDSAAGAVDMILGPHDIPNLIVSILIVGVLAGFSEEIFFRGALQRLLASARIGNIASIWTAAFIFSAIHMQFFGFVPRLLLGAYFGYLLMWSGSLWLPVLAHTVNNSLYIILKYTTGSGDIEPASAAGSAAVIAISAILTAAGLWILWKNRVRPDTETCTQS